MDYVGRVSYPPCSPSITSAGKKPALRFHHMTLDGTLERSLVFKRKSPQPDSRVGDFFVCVIFRLFVADRFAIGYSTTEMGIQGKYARYILTGT